MNPSAAGAAGGAPPVATNRNDVSAYERSQILNSLLNAAVDQKPKDKQTGADGWGGWGAGGAAEGWGTGGGAAAADGWGQQPQGKEKEKEKKKEKRGWVRWGSKVKKEDSAAGKDKKGKKKGKKEDEPGPWGTTVIEEEEWGRKESQMQQKGGWEDWGGEGDTSGWGTGGQPKGTKKHGEGARDEWGGGGGGGNAGAWGGGGGNEDGWGANAGTYAGDDSNWEAQGGHAGEESWGGWDAGNQSQSRSKEWGGQGGWGGENGAPGMTSQTMLHAREASFHPSSEQQQPVTLLESNGLAFEGVKRAFIRTRSSKDRFHWLFPPENDARVMNIINWIKLAGPSVATMGLQKFLQSRERGALFVNAAFRLPEHPRLPVFDWMTFDQLQATADKMLQESVYSYNPAAITVVFIYLPSPSGNSVAIWRRKVPVPQHCAVMWQKEIGLVMMGLRPNKEYICWVDEPQPPKQQQRPHSTVKHHSMQQYPIPMKQYPAPSIQQSAAMQHAAMYKSANASHVQHAKAHQPVLMKKQPSAASLTPRKVKTAPTKAKVEVKKKRKWWQIFK
ncbi:hypothetical protein BKA70DRAFT_1258887 [Coprinopsis sp. MPI-PUGE-AT-0042]|nr:hypothetical protein BKA70DRAFT_1258887 [Coprinopsis sp. MPI-PUGE-AT-0042]